MAGLDDLLFNRSNGCGPVDRHDVVEVDHHRTDRKITEIQGTGEQSMLLLLDQPTLVRIVEHPDEFLRRMGFVQSLIRDNPGQTKQGPSQKIQDEDDRTNCGHDEKVQRSQHA